MPTLGAGFCGRLEAPFSYACLLSSVAVGSKGLGMLGSGSGTVRLRP